MVVLGGSRIFERMVRGGTPPKGPFDETSAGGVDNFRAGDHVVVVGLQNRRELNGRTAFVGECKHELCDIHLAPLALGVGHRDGLSMHWVDPQSDDGPITLKVRPLNLQGICLAVVGLDPAFARLGPIEKVGVQRAQKALYDLASMYKDGRRKPPNVVALFRSPQVTLVREPPADLVPAELGEALVVRKELDPKTDGVSGVIHVVASCQTARASYHSQLEPDGTALGGKQGADAYLQAMPQLYSSSGGGGGSQNNMAQL